MGADGLSSYPLRLSKKRQGECPTSEKDKTRSEIHAPGFYYGKRWNAKYAKGCESHETLCVVIALSRFRDLTFPSLAWCPSPNTMPMQKHAACSCRQAMTCHLPQSNTSATMRKGGYVIVRLQHLFNNLPLTWANYLNGVRSASRNLNIDISIACAYNFIAEKFRRTFLRAYKDVTSNYRLNKADLFLSANLR